MELRCIEFETSYGPGYIVYRAPVPRDRHIHPELTQLVVECPEHIVWDDQLWYPEPYVLDEYLPKARAVCQILGIPPYDWLRNARRSNVWAVEQSFDPSERIGAHMEHNDR